MTIEEVHIARSSSEIGTDQFGVPCDCLWIAPVLKLHPKAVKDMQEHGKLRTARLEESFQGCT